MNLMDDKEITSAYFLSLLCFFGGGQETWYAKEMQFYQWKNFILCIFIYKRWCSLAYFFFFCLLSQLIRLLGKESGKNCALYFCTKSFEYFSKAFEEMEKENEDTKERYVLTFLIMNISENYADTVRISSQFSY